MTGRRCIDCGKAISASAHRCLRCHNLNPERARRQAASLSERRSGWCPLHLRTEARRLVRNRSFPIHEVKQIILSDRSVGRIL